MNEAYIKTFDDIGKKVLNRLLQILDTANYFCDVVTVVFDRYDQENSIKRMERERRGAGETTPSHQIFGARIVPNYKLFLKCSANKAALAEFVSKYLASQAPAHLPEGKSIVIAGGFADGKRVMHLTYFGGAALENMFSTQEEADTRMVLHAISLSKDHYRVIVQCDSESDED
ncbi:UNVERIFIED_CONTAM: hypothetical protein FKN15_028294 [Acipenser sinensis]